MAATRPARLKASYGMHVSGADFWPRPEAVEDLVAGLAAGESFTMFGLRRIGKSSVMAEVRARLAASGAVVVHVDAQNFRGLAALFGAILRGLPDKTLRDRVREKLADGVMLAEKLRKKIGDLLQDGRDDLREEDEADLLAYWTVIAPAVGERLAESSVPFILCIDELPMLFQKMLKQKDGAETANRLLAGLREWRGYPRVAMFLTGSVGMRGLVKAHGLDGTLLNDLTEVSLRPLPLPEAEAMVRALVAGSDGALAWDDALHAQVLDRLVEFHPSLIQFAFRRLLSARARDSAAIDRVFRDIIRPGVEQNFFAQFTDRLAEYGPAKGAADRDRTLLNRLDRALSIVAGSDAPIPFETFQTAFTEAGEPATEIEDIIAILREDGFLAWDSDSRTLALADRMVRAWWRSRPRG